MPSTNNNGATASPRAPAAVPPPPPGPTPGPFTRWPRGSDAVLALAMVVLGWATAPLGLVEENGQLAWAEPVDVPLLGYGLMAVSGSALYWRRRNALAVLAVVFVAVTTYDLLGFSSSLEFSIFIAIYAVGRYVADRRKSYLGLGLPIVFLVVAGVAGDEPVADVLIPALIAWVTWFVGYRLRTRTERIEDRERELRAQAELAAAAERAHIARELHDVVAHRVSMMTVQAGAAKTVAGDDLGAAIDAMATVEHEGRQALTELRHLLDVLRPRTDVRGLGPQPGLADIPELVDQHAEKGMDVSLSTDGEPANLSGPVDLSAYRIVQEALTNVFKHAGPDAHADVQLSADSKVLTIEVADTGAGGTIAPGSGFGIIGMRERAQLLGGSLDAEPDPDGGFRVVARLPIAKVH